MTPSSPSPAQRGTRRTGEDRILSLPYVVSTARLVLVPWFVWLLLQPHHRDWFPAAVLLKRARRDRLGGRPACPSPRPGDDARQGARPGGRPARPARNGRDKTSLHGQGAVPVPIAMQSAMAFREGLVAGATVALAMAGARRIDVTLVGKAGTFGLMLAFPLFLAGHSLRSAGTTPRLVLAWVAAVTVARTGLGLRGPLRAVGKKRALADGPCGSQQPRAMTHDGEMTKPARSPSFLSLWSDGSALCIASKGSFLSIGSVGSVLSIGSIGSFLSALSIGSAGSVLTLLSTGSRLSVLSFRVEAEAVLCCPFYQGRVRRSSKWTGAELALSDLKETCSLTGHFVLRSGRGFGRSLRQVHARIRTLAVEGGRRALRPLVPEGTEILAGLELRRGAARPLPLSLVTGLPQVLVPASEAKTYGTAKLAEGPENCRAARIARGGRCDHTTGGQVVLSTEELRARGALVGTVLCVIDRRARGSVGPDKLAEASISMRSLFTLDEILGTSGD